MIRQRIEAQLSEFVRAHRLGIVVEEMDFRLGSDTVRNPDVAYITAEHLKNIDPDRSPVNGAPALAIEVISPSNPAQETQKKCISISGPGARQSGWFVQVYGWCIHDSAGIRDVKEPDSIHEDQLFPGLVFSLSLTAVFDDDLQN